VGEERVMLYFIKGISASGQANPTTHERVKPGHVPFNKNHRNSAAANNM